MVLAPFLKFACISTYILLSPCILAHLGIILTLTCGPTQREPTNYLVVNLSFGAILKQMGVGLVLLEQYVSIQWGGSALCGLRASFVRTGSLIISFTLTLLVIQGSYFTRHPESNASSKYKSSPGTIVVILMASIILCLPILFMRTYDPNDENPFKCIQVILLDSVLLDSIYRLTIFIFKSGVPAFILLREVGRLMHAYKAYGLNRLEEQGQAKLSTLVRIHSDQVGRQRLRFLRNSCTFIVLFVCFSVPYALLDAVDSPAFKFSKQTEFYKLNIEFSVYLVGYFLIEVYPIYVFLVDRYLPH